MTAWLLSRIDRSRSSPSARATACSRSWRFCRSSSARAASTSAAARLRSVMSVNVTTVPAGAFWAAAPAAVIGKAVYSAGKVVPSLRKNTSVSTRQGVPVRWLW